MLPFDADPALFEAAHARDRVTQARRALTADRRRGAAPDQLAILAEDLTNAQANYVSLLDGPLRPGTDARHQAEAALRDQAAGIRAAVLARRAETARAETLRRADAIAEQAAASGRALTEAEALRAHDLHHHAAAAQDRDDERSMATITSPSRRDAALRAHGALRVREARSQLAQGLLLTEQMRDIIAEAMPSLLRGAPVLLLGETGGAKTALAEYLSRVGMGREPELVSGYGDITGAQLIGTHELHGEGGATVSAFTPGPLLRAMAEGRPLILDEVNAMPPEFLKRLNRILQLRPGDEFAIQEDGGRRLRLAPGFAILATANEQTPHRYRGLDRLSAELINRFGANSYRVHYPDRGVDYTGFPRENALLAAASVVDERGELPRGITADEIERLARAAFISQHVFSGAHGAGFGEFVSTEREIDGRPGLDESVIAPRTMVAIAQKVAGSAGAISLERALARFVEGVMHREDRHVLTLILRGQGFRVA